ncbi:lymphocyte function-associated antigen 3 isoform 2-T2 [Morus bassanus]
MRLPAWLGILFFDLFLAHIHCEDVSGIVGENFTFPVKIDNKFAEITWTKNKDKVAEWEVLTETTYFNSLCNRGLLNKENGCLTIFNLQNNDSGTYMLDYVDSQKRSHVLTFTLAVLAPPSEPEISCNISGDNLMLKCTADFPKPLNYTWKFSSKGIVSQTQEVLIPKKDVDASEKASCFITFSQTEQSSEISLTRCFPDEKDSYHRRHRGGFIAFVVLAVVIVVAGILGCLWRNARTKLGTRRAAQKNSPACSSGEHQPFCSPDGQEQPNSRAAPPQAVDDENEKPEADKELNKEDSALKDKQTVNSAVNQEKLSTKQKSTPVSNCAVDHGVTEGDTSKENSSSLANHPDDHGINEREMTQDAESGNREHSNNSPSSRKEDLKSQPNNGFVDQTMTEEKR